MFARLLELTIKPEKKPELIKTLRNDVLPIVKKTTGFLEMIPLEVQDDPTRFYVMSLWHEKRNAEQFHKEHIP